jgi:DNA-binding LytR/AlgR family response regulator
MIINIAICDDDESFLKLLKNELYKEAEKMNYSIEVYPYSDGNRVVDLICNKKENFDILFLDIDMPNISGLEIAKSIRENDANIILIFLSAHEQYVFESIQHNPFRYIRKSRLGKELFLAMKAAFSRIEELEEKQIIVKTEEANVKVNHSDIMYFETVARKVELHLCDGEVLTVRKTIKELCEELKEEYFIRIHSGCVANARYIDKFSSYDITLDNGEQLVVSRTRVKNVKEVLLNYWGDKA